MFHRTIPCICSCQSHHFNRKWHKYAILAEGLLLSLFPSISSKYWKQIKKHKFWKTKTKQKQHKKIDGEISVWNIRISQKQKQIDPLCETRCFSEHSPPPMKKYFTYHAKNDVKKYVICQTQCCRTKTVKLFRDWITKILLLMSFICFSVKSAISAIMVNVKIGEHMRISQHIKTKDKSEKGSVSFYL